MSEDKEELILQDDEKSLVLDHTYDGIRELNHPLPSWWIGTWVLSIVFAVPYFMYYVLLDGPTLKQEFNEDMARVQLVIDVEAANNKNFSIESYNSWVAANDGEKKGKIVFEENCLSCHAQGGGGDIGPNLTDKYWIHTNGKAKEIYPFVIEGFEDNGMPAWGEMLEKDELMAVVSYIVSIQGTTPPLAKDPQGKLIK